MQADRLPDEDFLRVLSLSWGSKSRLLAMETRRPRSLEVFKNSASVTSNESLIFSAFQKHPGEVAEKQFALVVHRIKKSRRSHKRKRAKHSNGRVADLIVRPQTWGPNGAKFAEFWDLLDNTLLTKSRRNKTDSDVIVFDQTEIPKVAEKGDLPAEEISPKRKHAPMEDALHLDHNSNVTCDITEIQECPPPDEMDRRNLIRETNLRNNIELYQTAAPAVEYEADLDVVSDILRQLADNVVSQENKESGNNKHLCPDINTQVSCRSASKSVPTGGLPNSLGSIEVQPPQSQNAAINIMCLPSPTLLTSMPDHHQTLVCVSRDQDRPIHITTSIKECNASSIDNKIVPLNSDDTDLQILSSTVNVQNIDDCVRNTMSIAFNKNDVKECLEYIVMSIAQKEDHNGPFYDWAETAKREESKLNANECNASDKQAEYVSTKVSLGEDPVDLIECKSNVHSASKDSLYPTFKRNEACECDVMKEVPHVSASDVIQTDEDDLPSTVVQQALPDDTEASALCGKNCAAVKRCSGNESGSDTFDCAIVDALLTTAKPDPASELREDTDAEAQSSFDVNYSTTKTTQPGVDKNTLSDSSAEPSLNCSVSGEAIAHSKVDNPKRPTSLLFAEQWPPIVKSTSTLDILKSYSTEALSTPTFDTYSADVFSEETELALEGASPLQRQDSFVSRNRRNPLLGKARRENQQLQFTSSAVCERDASSAHDRADPCFVELPTDTFQATPTNSFVLPDDSFHSAWLKCQSLPAKLKPDYASFEWERDNPEAATKRDSTISRESAASSGTVVASDEEDTQRHLMVVNANLANAVSDENLGSDAKKLGEYEKIVKAQMVRSKSLDREGSLSCTKLPDDSPSRHLPNGVMRNCFSVALSAPAIAIGTTQGVHSNNDIYRLQQDQDLLSPSTRPFASNASLLSKNSSYYTEDSEVYSSSSVPSSPTSSPRLRSSKFKYKGLRDKETKIAERQASEACAWLRAAGFPQYAHLYEEGNFPVDIASVTTDHDFLAQEHIAPLVRRLDVLNKCATMKLDKPSSKESQTDEEEEEDEPCAISEFWHLEDDGRRWSRLDSKGSHLNRLPSSPSRQMPHLEETHDEPCDVFTSLEGTDSEIQSVQQKPIIDGAQRNFGSKNPAKSKSNSFLKRVGGDLKKFGSFRRMQRTHSTDGSDSRTNKPRLPADHRSKGLRKNGKIVISEPTLQSGHDKIDRLRCVPIEQPAGDIRELHSQHLRGRKNSSHSLVSSSSSSGSGATSTASTPAGRFRSFTEDPVSRSHSGDLDSISPRLFDRSRVSLDSAVKARAQTLPDAENTFFVMPKDHVRGKFPTAIRELDSSEDQCAPAFPFGGSESSEPQQNTSEHKIQRPVSVYDNLPQSALHGSASAQDLMNILDPAAPSVDDSGVFIGGSQESLDARVTVPDAAFWSVDDIVEQTQSLQQIVSTWDHEQNDEAKQEQQPDSNSVDLQATSNDVLPSYSSETMAQTEDESAASNRVGNGDQRTMLRQARLRWESFHRDHATGCASQPLQLHNLSVGQLMILRRLSMLKLTALLESYALNTSKGSLSWSVPRFIRRIKVPDYKDKAVFGVPLLQNVKRFGQPLPQCIQHALAYMRRTALDQVGLFRKPGVRSRIHKLRASCEENPLLSNFDECSAYDVADMVKQFFRELPDPLMTMKLSETFVGVFLYVPKELWLQTLQAAVMLLPDETRETLKTLICFLSDVAARSSENHMNETNLATCFAPSLFYQQFGSVKSVSSSSPKVRKQQGGKGSTGMALGRPDMKEMNENAAANNCLAFMIRHVKNLFKISEDAMTQCRMSVMQQSEDVLADEIGLTPAEVGDDDTDYYADFHAYVDRVAAQTMREEQRISQNKGGWQNVPTIQGSDLMFRKMSDGNPLRLWRCQVEVDGADVRQVMDRVLHERHLWDEDLVQWKVLQQPDERTQLFQTVRAEMSPHPSRDYCVLRSWRTDVNARGAAVIVEASTSQPNLLGDIRGVVLTSRYVIEPTEVPTKCLLTHVCRVDTKGRNPEWYNKAYGHVACQLLLRLRDSIHEMPPKSSQCSTSA